jgi:hypothetical protein
MTSVSTQFQPGNPGRLPGYANAGQKYNNIIKTLDILGFDWVLEAVTRYRDPETPNASKDYCLGLITDRVAPKLKAIEVTGANGSSLQSVLINVVAGNISNNINDLPVIQTSDVSANDRLISRPDLESVSEPSLDDLGNDAQTTPECG